jgi:radical SAM protein (TIGR01212 family)
MQGGTRFNSISDELKRHFGRKTIKLGIDAGFTCPNRDGRCGYGGCAFCSGGGSGELAAHMNVLSGAENAGAELAVAASAVSNQISASISEQIALMSDKWPDAAYLAYFQSHTNTYAPAETLRTLYNAALDDPRIEGIVIATRPDCLAPDVLDLLSEINRDHYMWVELGLQTVHDETSRAMGIGYTYETYEKAVDELISRGIRVVTHLILGLPGETQEMMLESVRRVCGRPVFGIKLHLMNIVRTSRLAETMPDYVPFDSIEEYVDLVIRCLEIIPPEITIHRLTGDVPRRLLISPEWSYRKRTILNAINRGLADRDTFQGAALAR